MCSTTTRRCGRLNPEALSRRVLFRCATRCCTSRRASTACAGKAFQGESFFTAENPPFGAAFTYHLKEAIKTKKQQRKDAEEEAAKKGETLPYPTPEQFRAEAEEEEPTVLLTVADADGKPVRTLTGPVTAGFHRVSWDLRGPAPILGRPRPPNEEDPFGEPDQGPAVLPGKFTVSLAKRVNGVVTALAGPQEFAVVADGAELLADADRKELAEFQKKVARERRALAAALGTADEVAARLEQARRAFDQTPTADAKTRELVRRLIEQDRNILRALRGDSALRARNENTPTSIAERVEYIVETLRYALAKPTGTQRESYRIASEELTEEIAKLRKLVDSDMKELDKAMDAAGRPGRRDGCRSGKRSNTHRSERNGARRHRLCILCGE